MKKRILKSIFLSLILLTFSGQVLGQLNEEESISRAPNVQSVQKFMDVPVDLANGMVNISIPLYTIEGRSLSVPLVLQYHSGGIKTSDEPSWVGLGWTLTGAGQVSRSVRSNPDEGISTRLNGYYRAYKEGVLPYRFIDYKPYQELPKGYAIDRFYRDSIEEQMSGELISGGYYTDGDPYNHFKLYKNASSLVSSANQYNSNFLYSGLQNVGNDVRLGIVDLEPDLFSVDVPGFSGEFMLSDAKTFKMMPYDNARIIALHRQSLNIYSTVLSSNMTSIDSTKVREFYGWSIQSEKGVLYNFGANGASFIDIGLLNKARSFGTMTEWPLEQMVDINTRDTITFTNKRLLYRQKQLSDILFDYVLNNDKVIKTLRSSPVEPQNVHVPEIISTVKENVRFYSRYVDGVYELDSILVCDVNSTLKKKIEFTYDQFKSSGRMKLESVRILGEDRVTDLGTYVFKYFDTLFTPVVDMQFKDTTYYKRDCYDYWGYYNHSIKSSDYSSSTKYRPSWPHTKLESLNGIIYPTGVKVDFEYEPNDYWKSRTPLSPDLNIVLNKITGGIRIKKITTRDIETGQTSKRSFIYVHQSGPDFMESSGYQNIPPSFFQKFQLMENNVEGYLVNYMNKADLRGPAVQYSFVREILDDGANGYIDYEFYNESNTPDSTFYTNYKEFGPRPIYRNFGNYPERYSKISYANLLAGKLKTKRVRSSQETLLEEEIYRYKAREMGATFSFLKAYLENISNFYNLVETSPPFRLDLNKYMSYINQYYEFQKYVYLSSYVKNSFDANGNSSTSLQEIYGHEGLDHNNPTWTKSYTSTGDTVEKRSIYAYDCLPNASGDPVFGLLKYVGYNPVVGVYDILNGNRLLSSQITYFGVFGRQWSESLFPRLIRTALVDRSIKDFSILNVYPISKLEPTGVSYLDDLSYTFSWRGNMLSRQKNGKPSETYIYDDKGRASIAKGINGNLLAYTSFENESIGGWSIASNERLQEGLTGKAAYNLQQGSIRKNGLNPQENYVLSYWTKNPVPLSFATAGIEVGQLRSINGNWRQYEHSVGGVTEVLLASNSLYFLDELSLQVKGGMLETAVYDSFYRPISGMDVSKKLTSYTYDGGGRLKDIKDQFGNYLKDHVYSIKKNLVGLRLYHNRAYSGIQVRRNNCAAGYSGELVTYTVPAGMFSSNRSQADADEKAMAHHAQNVQTYANSNGGCSIMYFNVEKYQNYTRSSCAPSTYGTTISYIVPAGKYSSVSSQSAADNLALNDIALNGQNYANSKNYCQPYYERRAYHIINSSQGTFNFVTSVSNGAYMDQIGPGQQKTVYLSSQGALFKGWITGIPASGGFYVKIGNANAKALANNAIFSVNLVNEATVQITGVILY